jgi:hypothetical protein
VSANRPAGFTASEDSLLTLMAPWGGRAGLFAAFAVAYTLPVISGYALKESSDAPADTLYPLANCIDALVGAWITRWLVPDLNCVCTDRAREFGGRLTVDATPGRGSRFALVFPLNDGRDQQSAGSERQA